MYGIVTAAYEIQRGMGTAEITLVETECLRGAGEHVHAAIRVGKEFRLTLFLQTKPIECGVVDEQRAGVTRIDLGMHWFAVYRKWRPHDNGRTLLAESDQLESAGQIGGTRVGGRIGKTQHVAHVVDLQTPVFEERVSKRPIAWQGMIAECLAIKYQKFSRQRHLSERDIVLATALNVLERFAVLNDGF